MVLAARIMLAVYALATLATSVLFGGLIWLFIEETERGGFGQMILLSVPFNIAFAVLAYPERLRWRGPVLMVLGPLYGALGLLLMWRSGYLDLASDFRFIWPAYPFKTIAAMLAGAVLIRHGELRAAG